MWFEKIESEKIAIEQVGLVSLFVWVRSWTYQRKPSMQSLLVHYFLHFKLRHSIFFERFSFLRYRKIAVKIIVSDFQNIETQFHGHSCFCVYLVVFNLVV